MAVTHSAWRIRVKLMAGEPEPGGVNRIGQNCGIGSLVLYVRNTFMLDDNKA
jgi:hypothetical protein